MSREVLDGAAAVAVPMQGRSVDPDDALLASDDVRDLRDVDEWFDLDAPACPDQQYRMGAAEPSWLARSTPLAIVALAVLLVVNPSVPRIVPDGRVLRADLIPRADLPLDRLALTATLANDSRLPVQIDDVGLATQGFAPDPLTEVGPRTLAAGGVLRFDLLVRPDCLVESPSASLVVDARSADGTAAASTFPLAVDPAVVARLCPPMVAGRNVLATGLGANAGRRHGSSADQCGAALSRPGPQRVLDDAVADAVKAGHARLCD